MSVSVGKGTTFTASGDHNGPLGNRYRLVYVRGSMSQKTGVISCHCKA